MSDSAMEGSNVGAILDAYMRALERGEAPPREELLKRHPGCAAELAAALDGLEFIRRATREMPRAGHEGPLLPERELLGDFRLVREVGRGGMAVVYEAEQVSLGRRVALKVLPFAAVLDPKQLQRFKNEALAAAHLHHPHIVPVFAVGCERGVHYYAMQLVEGQSLAAVIREMRGQEPTSEARTPMSSHGSHRDPAYVRMAVALGRQAAEALDHAHELGIVHRDVKPANLLVDGTGELWITDFGLARSVRDGDLTITGELLGTYRYMSPEQTRAKRVPMDHRTDVYSLGVTLYELLTLAPAFPGDDPHEVMRDIAEKEPVPPRKHNPALPVDLETILLKSMSKDPSSRYATAQEMAEDLARYLGDQPILARRPSLAALASRWARRHRGFVAAAAVVLLLGLVALAADNLRVEAEQGKTKAALAKANDNLVLARSAVDKFLVEIGVSNMADQPVPKPQRTRLLEMALRFHERMFDDHASIASRVTIYHALHRYEAAVALLDDLIVRDPGDAWAHMQRGHMLWHVKRFDGALAELDRAIAIDAVLAEAHSFKGCVLGDQGRTPEALTEHERAIELDPTSAPFHNYKGNDLYDLRRPQEALDAYQQACVLDPDLPNPHCGRGAVLTDLGRLDEALAEYEKAIAVDPNHAWGYTGRGMTLTALGRLDEAQKAHDRAIELEPDSPKALVNRALTSRALGRTDAAIADDLAAIRLDPALVQARENLAAALIDAGQFDEAERQARTAVELAPKGAHAHFNLGCVFTSRKDWPKAIDAYQAALLLDPKFRPALDNLGGALLATGRIADAIEQFNKALDLDKEDAEALGGLGNALREKGDFKAALAAYDEVVRIKPDYSIGHYCRGTVLARLGKHADAIAEYDAALQLKPGDADVCRAKAKAYGAKGDLDSEIGTYEEALRMRKDYAEVHAELGRALNDRGDHDRAIVECNEALKLDPGLAEAQLNLGNALCDKHELDAAIAHLREAIRLLSSRVPDEPAARSERIAHDARILSLTYNSLGCALADKRELEPALAAYRDAIKTDDDNAPAHYNLAKELYGAGNSDEECERHYLEAIRIEADMAEAHYGLGRLYMAQNRFREALPYLRRGHELGSRRRGWRAKSAEAIATAERKVELEDRLPDVLSGAAAPHDERERTEFALVLYAKRRFDEAARLLELALENEPALADDLDAAVRYNAACTAVLAAAGGAPDAIVKRGLALRWLRADLDAREKAGDVKSLLRWKQDGDFKSVRDEIAKLPETERDGWTRLWSDVDERIARSR
jgi:tetratricopeptide (TPR) repeat protein